MKIVWEEDRGLHSIPLLFVGPGLPQRVLRKEKIMVTVTKRFEFCYAHHLPEYEGKCKNVHGHNSIVEVTFESIAGYNPYPGMVIDFSEIKKYVQPIIDVLDHKYLNNDISLFTEADFHVHHFYSLEEEQRKDLEQGVFDVTPTAENIAMYIVHEIHKTPIGEGLTRVRVYETLDNWAEWNKRVGVF
jgi:queuosine biosynthesis protein QueD